MLTSYLATLPAAGTVTRLSDVTDDLPYRQLCIEPAAANAAPVLLSGQQFGEYPSVVLASGPLAYYRLDEGVIGSTHADSSGNGHTLTPAGTPLAGTAGKHGMCVSFDGVNDKLSTTNGVQAWHGKKALSFEAWVYNAAWAATHEMIVSLGAQGLYLSVTSGTLIMSIHVGTQYTNTALSLLSTSTWTHVVGTWASGEPIRLYVNGAALAGDTSSTARVGQLSASPNIHVGAFGGTSLWYSGLIDEPAVYLRQLPAGEILNHYTVGAREIATWSIDVGAKRLTLGPFDTGPVKLSHMWAAGPGALTVLGVPF